MSDSAVARPSAGRRFLRTLKSFVLWSHERGTWQYDVMCALIAAFVLFAPARWFHDQPVYNPWQARDIIRLDQNADAARYRVSARLIADYTPGGLARLLGRQPPPDSEVQAAAGEVLARNLNHPFTIVRIEEVRGDEDEVVWYDIWVRE
ncbi:MAG: hypothetical protein ACRD5I_06835 [Candidatus Acidiferrales bacterium]